MAKTTKSVDKQKILARLKSEKKEKPEKRNITFRFDSDLIENFRKDCEKNGFKMNEVVDKMIKDFLGK
jgi:uncharacterized protein (DUF4415 family)